MGTEEAKKLAGYIIDEEKIDNIESLAHNVEDFWLNQFSKRFPNIDISRTDKDALTHFWGQTLSQQQEGTTPTVLAGLFNELRGVTRGYTPKSIIADLINNISAVLPDLGEKQQADYGSLLSQLVQNPDATMSEDQMQKIIDYGLFWTVNPPETQRYKDQ